MGAVSASSMSSIYAVQMPHRPSPNSRASCCAPGAYGTGFRLGLGAGLGFVLRRPTPAAVTYEELQLRRRRRTLAARR